MVWTERKRKKEAEDVRSASALALDEAISKRNKIDLSREWWRRFYNIASEFSTTCQFHIDWIGHVVVSVSVAGNYCSFHPISGKIYFRGDFISVHTNSRAHLHLTRHKRSGEKKGVDILVISGDEGIRTLLRNVAEDRRIGRGLTNSSRIDRVMDILLKGIFGLLIWLLHDRYGLVNLFQVAASELVRFIRWIWP